MADQKFRYFLATVISSGLRLSKTKRTPSISFQFQATADISDNPDQNFKPCNMYADLYCTPDSIGFTYKTLREAFGWDGSTVADFSQPLFIGNKVKLVCALDENDVLKVKFINRVSKFAPLSQSELQDLCTEVDVLLKPLLSVGKIDDDAAPNHDDGCPF